MDNIPTTLERQEPERKEDFHGITAGSDNSDTKIEPLKGFFNIKHPSIEDETDMKYIMNYFVQRNVIEMPLILLNIRNVENRLGALDMTMSRLKGVKNYLKTQAQIELLQAEQRSMMR